MTTPPGLRGSAPGLGSVGVLVTSAGPTDTTRQRAAAGALGQVGVLDHVDLVGLRHPIAEGQARMIGRVLLDLWDGLVFAVRHPVRTVTGVIAALADDWQ